MSVLVIVEAVVLLLLTVLVAGLLRAYANVLQRLEELSTDSSVFSMAGAPAHRAAPAVVQTSSRADWTEAHDISGVTLRGELVSVPVVGVEHDTVLLFLSSGCSTCAVFWDELATPGAVHLPAGVRLLVVSQGLEFESEVSLLALSRGVPEYVEVILSTEGWSDYEVPGSPYVVLVDGATGRVRGEGTGRSWSQVAELLARGSGDAAYLTGGPSSAKPHGDAEREADVDRELIAAGILPGDPRLYPDGQPPAVITAPLGDSASGAGAAAGQR